LAITKSLQTNQRRTERTRRECSPKCQKESK